jgi:hypothetical protein
MHQHPEPSRWLGALLAVGLAVLVGAWTYNLGLAHGLATQLPAAAGPYPWAFYRPWDFGFPVFLCSSCSSGSWRSASSSAADAGAAVGGYYGNRDGVPPMFEEWHRRAHEQEARPTPPSATQG